jgi:hypothetical protein
MQILLAAHILSLSDEDLGRLSQLITALAGKPPAVRKEIIYAYLGLLGDV